MEHQHRTHKLDRALEGDHFQAVCACGHRGPPRETTLGARRALEVEQRPVSAPGDPETEREFLARTRLFGAVAADLDDEPF